MEIYKLIPKIMADIEPVAKSQTNTFQKYKFRGIDDFLNAANPVMSKHGVFCISSVLTETHSEHKTNDGKNSFRVLLKVSHKFYAHDGSFVECVNVGEGVDTSDKATNKAMTAALKYALLQTFCVPTEDMIDGDRDHVTFSSNNKPPYQGPTVPLTKTTPKADFSEFDDSSFHEPEQRTFSASNYPANKDEFKKQVRISDAQGKRLFAIAKGKGLSTEQIKEVVGKHGFTSSKDLNVFVYEQVIDEIQMMN